jgi:hypothetical protein
MDTLPHFDQARRAGSPDLAFSHAFAALLAQYGYKDRYGLALLHRHFDLEPGETLLETPAGSRATRLAPVAQADLATSAVPTLWRAGDDRLRPIQYCAAHRPQDPEPPPRR